MTRLPAPDLATLLREAERILVFTGAGISTGSGIPDFRGPSGVWKTQQPVYYDEFMSSESARIAYWSYKSEGWKNYRHAEPNAVHLTIAELEHAERLLMVVTQNIDGLHSKAGTSDERLVELHGTNRAVACQSCHARSDPQEHFDRFERDRTPPVCACGGWLKPATISFGQSLRQADIERAAAAAATTDLVIAMGSSLSVHPAASIPLLAAKRGCPYVIINRGQTDHDGIDAVSLRLDGDVASIFPPAVHEALNITG